MTPRHPDRTEPAPPVVRRWGATVGFLLGVLGVLSVLGGALVWAGDQRWRTEARAAAQDGETRRVAAELAEKTLATAKTLAVETAAKSERRDEKISALSERVSVIEGQLRGITDDQKETLRLLRGMSRIRFGGGAGAARGREP